MYCERYSPMLPRSSTTNPSCGMMAMLQANRVWLQTFQYPMLPYSCIVLEAVPEIESKKAFASSSGRRKSIMALSAQGKSLF